MMKSVKVLFTLILLEVSILPVYLEPIYEGDTVKFMTEYPYMCGIFRNLTNSEANVPCGCAILSPNFALTAAHCFDDTKKPDFPHTLFAGSLNFNEGQTREFLKSRDVIFHPNFFKVFQLLKNFNLAIVKLNPPLNFTDNIKSIRLPGPNECEGIDGDLTNPYADSRHYTIAGWGSNNTYNFGPNHTFRWQYNKKHYFDTLLSHKVVPEKQDKCKELYNSQGYSDHNNICSTDMSSACFGDMGGPLSFRDITKEFLLCGISTYQDREDCKNKNTVYMKVSFYLEWICQNTNFEPEGCLEFAHRKKSCGVFKPF